MLFSFILLISINGLLKLLILNRDLISKFQNEYINLKN